MPLPVALKPQLDTPWTDQVSRALPRPEYPRPQMVRENWLNLNGRWDFTFGNEIEPMGFTRKILVPFAPESYLSGVQEVVPDDATMWYRRTFTAPEGERILLHFGAVDWKCRIWVNGEDIGRHEGGFDAFTLDVTRAIVPGENEILVSVRDLSDSGPQPRGKQVKTPKDIYYVPSSGIWQTVWVEGVPKDAIRRLKMTPRMSGELEIELFRWELGTGEAWAEILDDGVVVARASGHDRLILQVVEPRLWSPDSPSLYDVRVGLRDADGHGDVVESYVGFREVGLVKDAEGRTRLGLNGEPIFHAALLDQGYWPDGLYTAPTHEAMIYDIDVTKRLGFNAIRKHVKVEPATWYAHCDRVGILVWQDMPSGERGIGPKDPDIERGPRSRAIFKTEYTAMIHGLYNHPSVVTWVLFNEGWGQFDTVAMSAWAKGLDPTRPLDAVTGWADRGTGDMHDWHVYPGPGSPEPEENRAAVLGEFGGLGLPIDGHMWQPEFWGYKSYASKADLTQAFVTLMDDVHALIGHPGLSAAIYTQTTDVETEGNGLMTYDRRTMKMDESIVRTAITKLFTPPPAHLDVITLLERETCDDPGVGWTRMSYDDASWSGTSHAGEEIWIRRIVEVGEGEHALRLVHDQDFELYIDGERLDKGKDFNEKYNTNPRRLPNLTPGRHILALHTRCGTKPADLRVVKVER